MIPIEHSPSALLTDSPHALLVYHPKHGQNKFSDTLITALNEALDIVEQDPGATSIITTGHSKYYSTGLDLQWLAEQQHHQPTFVDGFSHRFNTLLARVLSFPLPTVAAISGHAIGGGAFFSLVHDFRIMPRHRGSFSIPLARVNFQLSDGLRTILLAKIPDPRLIRDLIFFARRLTPIEALKAGVIDHVLGHVNVKANSSTPVSIAPAGLGPQQTSSTGTPQELLEAENVALIHASLSLIQQRIPKDLLCQRDVLASLKERLHAKPIRTLRNYRVSMPIRPELGFAHRIYAEAEHSEPAAHLTAILGDLVVSKTPTPQVAPAGSANQSSGPSAKANSALASGGDDSQCTECVKELTASECLKLRPARLYSSQL